MDASRCLDLSLKFVHASLLAGSKMVNAVMLPAGSDKHQIKVPGPEYTVGQLLERLAEITEIPTSAQKVIFKGM